ncbi:MAG: hypothetical protein HZC02_00505 [Candidatus Levybacteria bacterium]|nr:hypothetical protein [Candidatus Levybacteria bacterium]
MIKTEFSQTGRVAVVDGGGRGHAIISALAESGKVNDVTLVPGNDYTKYDIEREFGIPVTLHKNISLKNSDAIVDVLQDGKFDMIDVAQDDAIAGNVAGRLRSQGALVVGADRMAGKLEWDKAYMRSLGLVPGPAYAVAESEEELLQLLENMPDVPYFTKAAYLAEGKGAMPAENKEQVLERFAELRARYPHAAQKIVVEEWMKNADGTPGDEFSHFIFTDGRDYQEVGTAVDYKTAYDFDAGENTGSMGSNSPTNLMSEQIARLTHDKVVEPLMEGLMREGIDYQGVIYVSGMVTRDSDNNPHVRVVEINSRLGDPEAQVIVPGLQNYYDINMAIATRNLGGMTLGRDRFHRVAVTGASRGYPGNYDKAKNKRIFGLEDAYQEGAVIRGAGMTRVGDEWRVSGGRLFYVVGSGSSLGEARAQAYASISHVSVEGDNLHYRTGIGRRDMLRAIE